MVKKTALVSVIALVATALIAAGAVSADDGEESRASSRNQLVGTWVVTVNRPAPLPPLISLQVFTRGGSVVEMASEPQAARSASYGSWERIERRLYASTMVFFRFHPHTGEYLGTRKINRTIELARDGQSFAHVARVTTFDPNGNPLESFTVRATGERMEIERIPDEP